MIDVLVSACLDRFRGESGWPKWIYGAFLASLMTTDPWIIVIFAVLFGLGEAPGWGKAVGLSVYGFTYDDESYEWPWWQRGIMRRNGWIAMFCRGTIWGAPLLLLAPFFEQAVYFPGIMGAGMVVGALAGRLVYTLQKLSAKWRWPLFHDVDSWGAMELVRGAVVGLLTLYV